jgi:hypothetical protein
MMTDDELKLRRANADELRAEQLTDYTLANCSSLATAHKCDVSIREADLYHQLQFVLKVNCVFASNDDTLPRAQTLSRIG